MGNIDLKLKRSGFREMLKSDEIKALLGKSAEQMKAEADSIGHAKYMSNVEDGRVSAHALVGTSDRHSVYSNAKYNTLQRSIDAGKV